MERQRFLTLVSNKYFHTTTTCQNNSASSVYLILSDLNVQSPPATAYLNDNMHFTMVFQFLFKFA